MSTRTYREFFYFTEHTIHRSVSDLSILELNIAILHCMFSEIKNEVYKKRLKIKKFKRKEFFVIVLMTINKIKFIIVI
jgi:hypothetical protein